MPVREPWFAALEEARRGLRASRDRRGERDAEIVRDLAVAGLQALDQVEAELTESERVIALCAADTTAPDLAQDIEFLKAALVQIIAIAKDEPGGLNYASRASRIARDALGWKAQ